MWSITRSRPVWLYPLIGIFVLCVQPSQSTSELPVLRIFNWSEYIEIDASIDESEPIVKRSPTLSSFVEKHPCEIEYYEYEDEALMREKIFGQPGFFDVVCMSMSDLKLFIEGDKLSPISGEQVPNKAHLIPKMSTAEFDPEGRFFIPFLVGTEGIVYREDILGEKVTTWRQYFDPPSCLHSKMGALNSAETMICAALKNNGCSINEDASDLLRDAARSIRQLKRKGFLAFVTSDIEEIQEKLLSGEMAMTVLYSGDALAAVDEDPNGNIAYTIPSEGGTIFMDSWVVLKDSQQQDLAYKFLNHILDPEVHASNAAYCRYICPNQAAQKIMKEKYPNILSNPSIYPASETMAKLEFNWGTDVAEWNRLWKRVIE